MDQTFLPMLGLLLAIVSFFVGIYLILSLIDQIDLSKLRKDRSQVYTIKKIKLDKSLSRIEYTLVIEDDGHLIPVTCSEEVGKKIYDLIELNGLDKKIAVKAEINLKDLSLNHVKGYLIK